jgi:peptidoglycan/LPS O-acetylase OafA/YrhL
VSPPAQPPSRLAFLDLAKGILVILMVVYHCLNYTSQYQLAFRYLSFLPPTFILITGYLISIVYYPRIRAGDHTVWARLLTRGAKLLLLFIGLNVVAQYVRSPVYGQSLSVGVGGFFRQWHEVFVVGAGPAVAFEVLLPIAYLLMLAPLLIWLASRHVAFLVGIALAVVVFCAWLDSRGQSNPNLNLLSAGLVGMVAGRMLARPETIGRPLVPAIVAYAAFFPLSLAKGYIYLVQLAGASIALVLICSASLRLGETGRFAVFMIRHGKYSLLAYIVQIGVLQILSRVLGRPEPVSLGSLTLFLATLLLMLGLTEITHWMRQRIRVLDAAYRLVFA